MCKKNNCTTTCKTKTYCLLETALLSSKILIRKASARYVGIVLLRIY